MVFLIGVCRKEIWNGIEEMRWKEKRKYEKKRKGKKRSQPNGHGKVPISGLTMILRLMEGLEALDGSGCGLVTAVDELS